MDHLELDEGTKFHKKHRKTQSLDFVYSFLYPISKPLDWFRAQREKSTRETLIILIFTVIGKPSKTHYFLLSLPGFFSYGSHVRRVEQPEVRVVSTCAACGFSFDLGSLLVQ